MRQDSVSLDPAATRLLYVAITRVQEQLDVPEAVLSFINDTGESKAKVA